LLACLLHDKIAFPCSSFLPFLVQSINQQTLPISFSFAIPKKAIKTGESLETRISLRGKAQNELQSNAMQQKIASNCSCHLIEHFAVPMISAIDLLECGGRQVLTR